MYLHFDILFYLIDFLLQWKIVVLTSVATGGYMAKIQTTSVRMVIPQAEFGKQDLLNRKNKATNRTKTFYR
jgi:hypothetical protein